MSWWAFVTTVLFSVGAVSYGVVILWTGEFSGRRGSVHTGPVTWLAGLAFVCFGVYAAIQLVRRFRR